MDLIDEFVQGGVLKTPSLIKTFRKIKREDFVLPEMKWEAQGDYPLPIGHGQTISQPFTVAFMLELLQPKKGDKVLDIGFGSGWTTALLAEAVGEKGKVWGIEVVKELKEFGEKNIAQYNFIKKGRVELKCADGKKGWPEKSPFDKILVSAMAQEVPSSLKEQLKIGGRLVIPIREGISLFVKKGENDWQEKHFPGFAFVSLV